MSPSYILLAASGDSSRNGEPGSIRRSTRSRGNSLPRWVCLFLLFSSPPSAARAIFSFSSATSFPIASALALKAALFALTVDLICVIDSLRRQHTEALAPTHVGERVWVGVVKLARSHKHCAGGDAPAP